MPRWVKQKENIVGVVSLSMIVQKWTEIAVFVWIQHCNESGIGGDNKTLLIDNRYLITKLDRKNQGELLWRVRKWQKMPFFYSIMSMEGNQDLTHGKLCDGQLGTGCNAHSHTKSKSVMY